MRFSVDRAGRVGLTARGTSRVLPLTRCDIAAERINDTLAVLARHALPRPQALVRYGVGTEQMLLQPAPTGDLREDLETLDVELRDQEFEEELAGQRFRIRPSSFFQTNTAQANVMARLARLALPSGVDVTLVDAYCGVGTFARLMAERAGRVLAIEESESAIRDARANLADAPNIVIMKGKVEALLPGLSERLDGLVIDPPRAGCQRPVLDALIARRVPRVVYISCGPESLARDLAILCRESGAYRLVSLQPLDMFPQTAHIENIAVLEAVETVA
jgi:23S rRNA (uracil1939-C5)-methyltransferase